MVFSSHILPLWCRLCISASIKCLFRLFPLYQIPFIFTLLSPICRSAPQGEPLKSCTSFLCSPLAKYSNWGQSSFKLTQCLRILTQRRGLLVRMWRVCFSSSPLRSLRDNRFFIPVVGWEDSVFVCVWDRHFLCARERCVIMWGISKIAGAMNCIKDHISHHWWGLSQFRSPSDA